LFLLSHADEVLLTSHRTTYLNYDPALYAHLMKFLLPSSIVPLLLSCLDLVGAVRLEIHGRSSRQENDARAVAQRRGFSVEKRSNIYTDNGIGILTNSDDISYYTSLTLGGKNFTSVLVDTGQSPSEAFVSRRG
jgi:hypothetical protein